MNGKDKDIKLSSPAAKKDFIKRLTQVILKTHNLDGFFNSIAEMSKEVFGVKWANLSLLNEATGDYTLKASTFASASVSIRKYQDAKLGGAFGIDSRDSWVKDRQKILTRRLLDKFGSQKASQLREELNKTDASISLPLFAESQLFGVLNLGPRTDNKNFSKEELDTLAQFSQLLAACVQEALYHHRVAEQKLHHQNILDNLVSGIIVIDTEEKITVFNYTAQRILKLKADEVLGKNVRILQANLANLLLDTLHRAKSYRREELYILPENTLIGISASQFYAPQGKLLGACMVFSSISEIKKDQRLRRQKSLDTYWSNIANSLAHEVKNAIVATKIFVEMLPQKYEDADFRDSLYSTLKRDMDKLDNFIEKVIDFAQPKELVIQSCQIEEVVNSAIEVALQNRDIGEIILEKRYDHLSQPLLGDYHQLKETFTQIIYNALEAMQKQGKLSIEIGKESGPEALSYKLTEAGRNLPQSEIVVIKIRDTGYGILSKDLPYLFDPFFTTKEARSGLGLAYSKKVIERHRGIIVVESSAEGTTFSVCLPILPKLYNKRGGADAQKKDSYY